LAHKARITESVVRDEIRKAAAARKTAAPAIAVAAVTRVLPAEQGLLWTLVHRPVEGLAAISQLESEDLEGLLSRSVLEAAARLGDVPAEVVPELLRERLTEGERGMLERAAAQGAPVGSAMECVLRIKRDRLVRELAEVQRQLEALQERKGPDEAMLRLLSSKQELVRELEAFDVRRPDLVH
jgi:hypothetical protein